MNPLFSVINREKKYVFGDKFMLFVLFGLPIIFTCISVAVFIRGEAVNLPVAICDQDDTDLSRQITRAIGATPACKIEKKVENPAQAKELLNGGKVYACLLIPKRFKSDIILGKRPQIVCYYNNQMILVGGLIIKDIQTAIANIMTGVTAKMHMKKGTPKYAAMSKIMPIELDERVKANPYLNYSYFLTYAVIAHIFQAVITLLTVWCIGREFRYGTTGEWLNVAQNSILYGVFGKLIFYGAVLFIMLIMVYWTYVVLGVAPFEGKVIFVAAGAIAFIFAYQMMGVAFMAVLSNMRFAMSVGAFYTSLGFSFSGMTFPSIALPEFGNFYSALLPIRPFVNLLIDQALRGFSPIYDLKYLAWMLCLAVPGIICLPMLKKHAKTEGLLYQI